MTTIIANPIYDAVFKFLMEDQKVAKILLSALLKKEIIELTMRRHEYTSMEQTRISLFRIDFAARVRDADGTENLILIELQKTWLTTETLRFRQYLGMQYLDKENMIKEKEANKERAIYGLPIVSIYILGHCLSDLLEPVIYVRRHYLDYDDKVLPAPDRFIESLTHDSIIVQIPLLAGRTRNRLEKILSVFDQEFQIPGDVHFLEISDDSFAGNDVQYLVQRLMKAAAAPDVRRAMEIEDEILSEIEARDTTIMIKDREIEEKEQVIEQKEQELAQNKQVIEQSKQELEQKERMLHAMAKMLCQNGMPVEAIAKQLSMPVEQVQLLVGNVGE